MNCPQCGTSNPEGASFCQSCGKRLSITLEYESFWGPTRTQISSRLALGGILAIFAGVLALADGSLYMIGVHFFGDPSGGGYTLCGITKLSFGVLSIAGGELALYKTSWRLAFICSFLGILGLGFMVGALIGGIAMIIIAVSREELH